MYYGSFTIKCIMDKYIHSSLTYLKLNFPIERCFTFRYAYHSWSHPPQIHEIGVCGGVCGGGGVDTDFKGILLTIDYYDKQLA